MSVTTEFEDFLNVKEALAAAKFAVEGEITMIPSTMNEMQPFLKEIREQKLL